GYGPKAAEVAAELAGHFEQGRDLARAVHYLKLAAGNAARRGANREAGDSLGRALELVERQPERERPVARLVLLEQRGLVRRAGGAMAAAATDFSTLAEEARRLGQVEGEAQARLYLASALSWGNRDGCLAAVDEAVSLIPNLTSPLRRAHVKGWVAYWNMLW